MVRFQSIECLRAWMAWWVVLGHGLHLSGWTFHVYDSGLENYLLRFLERGSTAVNTFIVVSGFVIAHLVLCKHEVYRPYIIRRWMRIFPIFALTLALAIILRPLYLEAYTELPWVYAADMRLSRASLETDSFGTHLLLHLGMIHRIVPEEILPYASSTFIAPGWSLSLEWQFYLVAPFLVLGLWNSRLGAVVLFAVILAITTALKFQDALSWRFPSFLPLAMPHFFLGILSRLYLQAEGPSRLFFAVLATSTLLLADWLTVIIWAIFFTFSHREMHGWKWPNHFLASIEKLLARNHVVANVGKVSYSTYLLHIPVFSIVVGAAAFLIPGLTQAMATVLVIFAMFLMLPVSFISYRMIEAPFARHGN